jgi:hypothetical protein
MPKPVRTGHTGHAAASKRLKKSVALVSHDAATGMFTIPAGFLNDLAPGDTVSFSALTGGSGITAGLDYYLLSPRWSLGATSFKVSVTPNGAPLTGGSNASAGTVSTGQLTTADDGVLSGNYVSQESPLGR